MQRPVRWSSCFSIRNQDSMQTTCPLITFIFNYIRSQWETMIERVSIMSTARDHSNIAPIIHPAESWHAENVRQFFAAIAYSFLLLTSGIGLRLAEYNLIKNQAERNRYKQNTFLHNFVLNNPYKDSANMLLALWTLIISVIIVTAFLETKTPESSSKARAFNVFQCIRLFPVMCY